MSVVWYVIVPVAIVALLFVLKALRDVGKSIGTLVGSVEELKEAGVGLSKIRDELAARRAPVEDAPPSTPSSTPSSPSAPGAPTP